MLGKLIDIFLKVLCGTKCFNNLLLRQRNPIIEAVFNMVIVACTERYDRKLWIEDFLRDVVYLPSE